MSTSRGPKKKTTEPADGAAMKALEPQLRVDVVTGEAYPKSLDKEWSWCPPVGWVLKANYNQFAELYAICPITKEFVRKVDARQALDQNGYSAYFSPSARFPAGDWVTCHLTSEIVHTQHAVQMDIDDEAQWLTHRAAKRHVVRDDYTGKHTYKSTAIPVSYSDTYKYISAKTYRTSGVFDQCPNCANVAEKVKMVSLERLGVAPGSYCPTCAKELARRSVIMPHDHAAYPKAIKTERMVYRVLRGERRRLTKVAEESPRAHRLFGVEAEVEVLELDQRVPAALDALNFLGRDFIICKHDGSLKGLRPNGRGGDYGFEIVTAPASLSVHRAKWENIESMPGFSRLRAWDTDTCGFHVHVTREALSHLQIGRILAFVNHPANLPFITKVAGRAPTMYALTKPSRVSDGLAMPERCDLTRRVAVNQTNEKTVEFRMFRGTIRGSHIIRNLEFVDALCDYCMPGSRSLIDMFDWRKLVDFIINDRTFSGGDSKLTWPILGAWLVKNQMCKVAGAWREIPGKYALRVNRPVDVVESSPPGENDGPPKVLSYKAFDPLGLSRAF